jgi:hypothetical protein
MCECLALALTGVGHLDLQAWLPGSQSPFALDQTNLWYTWAVGLGFGKEITQVTVLGSATFAGKVGEAFQWAHTRADQAEDAISFLFQVEDAVLLAPRWERLCARLNGGCQLLRLQQRMPSSFNLPSENDRRSAAISRAD